MYINRGPAYADRIEELRKIHGKKYRYGILYQNKPKTPAQKETLRAFDVAIRCNFGSQDSLTQALRPYQAELLVVTCTTESAVPYLQKVIPHIPYVRTPTVESLHWATDKLAMRKRFYLYDPSMTPRYKVIHNARKKTIQEIGDDIGFPVIIKPTGLASSLLVTAAYHHDELESSLRRVFRKISKLHREANGRGEPTVLVEQLMDGEMYSVDAHVSSRGAIYFNPFVHVKTGRTIGFDDFFGYQRTTPTRLNKQSITDAEEVSTKAIRALGLRSTSAHIELLKTDAGWKIIEVGPRTGGFRHKMYELSYGINLFDNDIAIRTPRKVTIPRSVKGYTSVIAYYAKQEGEITKLTGIKKAQELKSFHSITINKQVGDRAVFAKHGGKEVFNITFFNADRSKLLADVRRFEQNMNVETKPKSTS